MMMQSQEFGVHTTVQFNYNFTLVRHSMHGYMHVFTCEMQIFAVNDHLHVTGLATTCVISCVHTRLVVLYTPCVLHETCSLACSLYTRG